MGERETNREKSRNAYVLIYERVVELDEEQLEKIKEDDYVLEIKDNKPSIENISKEIRVPDKLTRKIIDENKDYWTTQYMFHNANLEFMYRIVAQTKVIATNKAEHNKFCFIFHINNCNKST